MVLQDTSKFLRIRDGLDVARQLLVPEQRVATDALAVLHGEVDEGVGAAETEATPGRLDRVPLHAVLGCQLPEVFLDNSSILGLG